MSTPIDLLVSYPQGHPRLTKSIDIHSKMYPGPPGFIRNAKAKAERDKRAIW